MTSALDGDRQVLPLQRGAQIGGGGAAAAAVADRHLQPAESLLPGAVVVVRPGMAGGPSRFGIGVEQRILVAAELRGERAVAAAIGVRAALPALQLAEIGQRMRVGPAGEAGSRPAVVIAAVAAHEGHGVGRRRAAHHLAARAFHLPPVGMLLRAAEIHPVVQPLLEDLAPAERNVDPGIAVPAAGLEQEHASPRRPPSAGRRARSRPSRRRR